MRILVAVIVLKIFRWLILFPLVLVGIAWTHWPFTFQDFIQDFLDILHGN